MTEPTTRRATNVSLPNSLVTEARALDVNLSRACEAGLAAAVKSERARRWRDENRAAMESWGESLPLARHRQF